MASEEGIYLEGKRNLPKFSEILRRPRGDNEFSYDSPDIDFIYEDEDSYDAEMSELYAYTEESELFLNKKSFDELIQPHHGSVKWSTLTFTDRKTHIFRLLNMTEVSDRQMRQKVIQALLMLCQGNFDECYTPNQHLENVIQNVQMLYNCGAFQACILMLNIEIENSLNYATSNKASITLSDNVDLRLILNILYTMVVTMMKERESDTEELIELQTNFKAELLQPISGDELLAITLFGMVSKFCSGAAPHYPIKKILLLLWKIVLFTLGGLHGLYEYKNQLRSRLKLSANTENTHEVCKHMRASSPPASAADLIEQHQQIRRNIRNVRKPGNLTKQSSLEDSMEGLNNNSGSENGYDSLMMMDSISNNGTNGNNIGRLSDDDMPQTPPRPASPLPAKGLPWAPKVRQKDLENFLEQTRTKFVGFNVKNDYTSLAGLPGPIHEGVKVLNQHLYISLGELQIKKEEAIAKNPLSMSEDEIEETPSEVLYRAMHVSLPQYMIALLKILLAAAPTSKAKTESVNILTDLLPSEGYSTVLQTMKLGVDANRHKEIIVKAISGLLLLLLKHYKLNHIYQFEYMSQHLVFANCIPLILKFFNQNISSYITAKSSISIIDYPTCIIGDHQELTAENLEAGDNQDYCWRNLFSCINLLRILNKLTKWKHSRTMMLVVFKSAPILKRALKVRHAMMQLYVLKLLKAQTKYLGRQWRKSNMKTMSAIYQKVRHRLTDDWAYGNDMDARPWDFQAEECALRTCFERFNNRRYTQQNLFPDFEPVDNCLQSVLGKKIILTQEFKDNYEIWLEREVFSKTIDWSKLLCK